MRRRRIVRSRKTARRRRGRAGKPRRSRGSSASRIKIGYRF